MKKIYKQYTTRWVTYSITFSTRTNLWFTDKELTQVGRITVIPRQACQQTRVYHRDTIYRVYSVSSIQPLVEPWKKLIQLVGFSGFHEAIGDTIALNVITDKHMHKIGLKGATPRSHEATIRDLLDTALEKITFLPSGFLIDQYRWELLRGNMSLDDMECGWWKLR